LKRSDDDEDSDLIDDISLMLLFDDGCILVSLLDGCCCNLVSLDDDIDIAEGLSRSKFASELITRSNDDDGGLILLAAGCNNTLYVTDFNSEDGDNALDDNTLDSEAGGLVLAVRSDTSNVLGDDNISPENGGVLIL
jgi:hypothetical protein